MIHGYLSFIGGNSAPKMEQFIQEYDNNAYCAEIDMHLGNVASFSQVWWI